MNLLGVNGTTTLDADELGLTSDEGYSFAVYVSAVDEIANELLNASLQVSFKERDASMMLLTTTLVLTLSTHAALLLL